MTVKHRWNWERDRQGEVTRQQHRWGDRKSSMGEEGREGLTVDVCERENDKEKPKVKEETVGEKD